MKYYLSLILACYNEAEHLAGSFRRLFSVLERLEKSYEIIFVDDKSRDNTLEIIREIIAAYKKKKVNFRLIIHRRNMGRGKSVADGIKAAKGQTAGYLDADLEVGPEYILKVLPLLNKFDLAVGKRSFPFSVKTIHRYIASKVYANLAKVILSLPVHDSEAGFKFFNRVKIDKILTRIKNRGWFWDTELVAVAHKMGLRIGELPVNYVRRTDKTSTVSTVKDSAVYLWNLIKFRIKS